MDDRRQRRSSNVSIPGSGLKPPGSANKQTISLRLAPDEKTRTHTERMALMYEKVISVISQPPSQRLDPQVQPLLPWFEKKSDIFRALEKDTLVDIIRNCEFLSCEENDVIIKQGEKGDCFFVLLRGAVSVYINNVISDADDPLTVQKHGDDAAPSIVSTSGLRKAVDKAKYGNYIAQIPAGKSFGELALISKDCIRNASIIAECPCDLFVVNRDLYDRSIRSAQEKDFEERRQFIESCPLFAQWPQRYKRQMAMSLRKEKLNFETHIMKQGEPVTALYFIHKGQGKVVMDPMLHYTQFPQLASNSPLAHHHNESGVLFHSRKSPPVTSRPSSAYLQKRRSSLTHMTSYQRAREICLIGSPDVVGDIEVVSGLDTYIETVVCSQSSEILVLDTRNFERLVVKKVPKTLKVMKESAQQKLESRINRVHNDIPLLPWILNKLTGADKNTEDWLHKVPIVKNKRLDPVPHRGPLIDQYGPGTVFYRNRERRKAKDAQKSKDKNHLKPVPYVSQVPHIPGLKLSPRMASGHHRSNTPSQTNGSSENANLPTPPTTRPSSKGSDGVSVQKDMNELESRILNWHMDVASLNTVDSGMGSSNSSNSQSLLSVNDSRLSASSPVSPKGVFRFHGDLRSRPMAATNGGPPISPIPNRHISQELPQEPCKEPPNEPQQYTLDQYNDLKVLLRRRSSQMHILPPLITKKPVNEVRRHSMIDRILK